MSGPGEQSITSAGAAGELEALRNGDRAETERFVRQHAGWMLALARRMLRNGAQADDAVQNAFANIFKNLSRFDQRSALKTWMHRIVVNEALMLMRKTHRLREEPIDELLPVFDESGCRIEAEWAVFQTPEAVLQQSQASAKITELINTLPENYRIVLMLRDIEELSTEEVAEMLDLSQANVKVRLHRARAALKKLLEPLMGGQAL
ncbi:MAG: sigma-70 family RNA polymerase sigma factor [Alphaproteobacteria bacterium]|nr:sigma-70 family RNA polymerase sigma factor [Alphaproteobacteria bacterium]